MENFKYLGAIISNEGSKPEILSRIAQTTAALSRLKIIWRDKNISLASKVKLMWTLIYLSLCLWELDLDSRNREKDPSPWDEMLQETSEHFLQRPCDERGGSQQNPECNWSAWWSPNHGKKRKLRWYGHISRSSGMAKTILQGTVKGARRRGRQKKRWEDNIKEWTGMGFGDSLRAAEDREGWKGIVAASSVVPWRPPRLRDWEMREIER